MGRQPKIDPAAVIADFNAGKFRFAADAAKEYGCSRTYMHMLLKKHAPQFLPGKVKPRSDSEQQQIDARQAQMKLDTETAVKQHDTPETAAAALGLTRSGLYTRMRRLGIPTEVFDEVI